MPARWGCIVRFGHLPQLKLTGTTVLNTPCSIDRSTAARAGLRLAAVLMGTTILAGAQAALAQAPAPAAPASVAKMEQLVAAGTMTFGVGNVVEIDQALMRHPGVAQAAAYAVPHPRLGEDIGLALREKSFGFLALLTDASSEMIYPLLPDFDVNQHGYFPGVGFGRDPHALVAVTRRSDAGFSGNERVAFQRARSPFSPAFAVHLHGHEAPAIDSLLGYVAVLDAVDHMG